MARTTGFRAAMAVGALVAAAALMPPTASAASASLLPPTYKPFPVGSISPKGWLLKQLELQAEGLFGHLSMFWEDVSDSVWVGGSGDGSLHERAPYWANGQTVLAFLLQGTEDRRLTEHAKIYREVMGGAAAVPGASLRGRAAAAEAAAPLCVNNTDMANGDIPGGPWPMASTQDCHDACAANDDCIGFVVNACVSPGSNVTCWLKREVQPIETGKGCRCVGIMEPPEPLTGAEMMRQVRYFVDYVLDHQDASGWVGPEETGGVTYWARFNVMLTLATWAEGSRTAGNTTEFDRVTTAMLRFVQEAHRRMQTVPLASWAAERYQDFVLGVEWLLDNAPQGAEAELMAVAHLAHSQGVDWEGWFETFSGDAGNHGVNNAQALKSAAVMYRLTGNKTLPGLSRSRMTNLDTTYGMPTGMFCADETLCEAPENKMPSRGTELCAVVEAMYSYDTMFSVHGDGEFADRAERIAYNALPATWASPTGGDLWAHQYLQAVNEIAAMHQDDHVWTHDGPDAEIYGLAPNFGCCTANGPQGWPKLAQFGIFFSSSDGGVVIGVFAPATAALPASMAAADSTTAAGASVDVSTSYPFDDSVTVTLTGATAGTPLYLRIPAWATGATVAVDGGAPKAVGQSNGTVIKVSAAPGGASGATTAVLDLHPTIRIESWYNDTVSVHRGALMYSVPVSANYTVLASYAFDSKDYALQATSDWRYALVVDPANPGATLSYNQPGYVAGAAPFNHTNWPATISAKVRPISSDVWGIEKGSAGPPPPSPVCERYPTACGDEMSIVLAPAGATDLRIGEMPRA